MSAFGIVSEFNPLHNGHTALFDAARRHGAACIVCAMSGNFVQRGDAAILDKFARAEMAVRCGADLVLELPTPWAMASAETFAYGGVSVLAMAQCGTLTFGSECGCTEPLQAAADALLSPAFDTALQQTLKSGVSFAAARQSALGTLIGGAADCLRSPNNTLGVEYLKAIRRLQADMTAFTVTRRGAAHDAAPADGIASASYLRERLRCGDERVFSYMPREAADVLRRETANGYAPTDIAYLERAVLSRLRGMTEAELAAYDSGREGLYHRLYDALQTACSLEALLAAAKTKRYPMARLRRMVLQAWLGAPPVCQSVPYLRVLAATAKGRAHLRELRRCGAPVLTKPADVGRLGREAAALFAYESRCTDQYALCRPSVTAAGEDWRYTPLMLF